MSNNQPFSTEFIARLDQNERFINEASKAVNPFSKFPGPDDDYYAQLIKIIGQQDKKDASLKVIASFMILADVPTSKQDYVGHIVRIQFFLRDSEKQTKQDAWNRLYTDLYQALGCVTASWPDRAKNSGKSVKAIMVEETVRLNGERPACVLSITLNKSDDRYHNVRIKEHLSHAAIEHFIAPEVKATDAELTQEQEAPTYIDESIVVNFEEQYEKAVSLVSSLDMPKLIEQAVALKLGINIERLSTLSPEQARMTLLYYYVLSAGRDPVAFNLLPLDRDPVAAVDEEGDVRVDGVKESQTISSSDVGPIIEEEDDPIVEEDEDEPVWDKSLACQQYVSSLDREGAKRGILKYEATSKFSKSMTDDSLRSKLFDFLMADASVTSTTMSPI